MRNRYNPRDEWPSTTYMSAWKVFRSLSDESEETAAHLLTQPQWPRNDSLVLVDVGCGDGLLMREVLLRIQQSVAEVRLIEPDNGFAEEADRNISGVPGDHRVSLVRDVIECAGPDVLSDASAVIAVHLIYLMRSGVDALLNVLPPMVPMYVVLDEPDSVFSRLWRKFAPRYLERSEMAHRRIREIATSREFSVNTSTIASHLANPLTQKEDIREAVLSTLCYTDLRDLEGDVYEFVEQEIRPFISRDRVRCLSSCYEIMRLV